LINLDISRTYQDKELFQNTTIKELLTNILFIWAKENPDPSYRQGMNEILAILLFAIYPFYFTFDKKSSISASSINSMKKDENFAKELYCFLYDEDEMQADLYCLFENMMKRGILNLYSDGNDESSKNGDKDSVHFI
jgi:TBC1 domain family protein 5